MKPLFIGLCLLMATALQAVTVKWSVQTLQYDWTTEATAYFVYSESEFSADNNYLAAYTAASGYKDPNAQDPNPAVVKATLSKNPVSDQKYGYMGSLSYDTKATGFYYLVFVKGKDFADTNEYAVAGGVQYKADGSTGVYNSVVDGEQPPNNGDYVEIPILGGTWTAAKTPEPTTFALLALGIAGLALRRKMR